jgi:hypothetical protein
MSLVEPQVKKTSCWHCFWCSRDDRTCRRHAPLGAVHDQGRWWPDVSKEDWCGDWEQGPWEPKQEVTR